MKIGEWVKLLCWD